MAVSKVFSFPNPVNEAAARSVAIGVVVMSSVALASNYKWLLIPLTYGFIARVLAGPTFSPLGQFAVRVAAPKIATTRWRHWVKMTPGPPKRFAQAMGAVFTMSATLVWVTVGWNDARWILVPLIVAASLEGFVGFCVGCTIFRFLMTKGLIPQSVCEECGDLSARFTSQRSATPPT